MKTLVILITLKTTTAGTWIVTTLDICEEYKDTVAEKVFCIPIEDKPKKNTFKFQ